MTPPFGPQILVNGGAMDTHGELAGRIDRAVEELEGELIAFLQRIVRIPTENPPGHGYPECAQAIAAAMREAGCAVETVEVPPPLLPELAPHSKGLPRPSVLGRYAGEAARPHLHVSGHYDVVPAGPGWTVAPFGGLLRGGRVYGRGAADQKSGIAAQIFALRALRRAGARLRGSLTLSATPDEETGGFAGMGYLVDRGLIGRENTDYVVITECLDVDRICLGHRGTFWFEVETRGRQSHGSMPSEGVNAIDQMVRLINAVRREILPELRLRSRHPVMPPACRRSTLTTTMIQAGTKINTVPASCRAGFDWRLVPEQEVGWARERMVRLCERLAREDPGFDYRLIPIMEVEPTLVPPDTGLVRAFRSAGRRVLGRPMKFSISPGSDDQKFVVQRAGLERCIVYGPGPLRLAHKSDEYQPVADLKAGTRVLALAAARLLGAEIG